MTWTSLCQLLAFLGLLLAITKPLGWYMARVFEGERTFLSKPLLPLEHLLYRLCGVNPQREQTWRTYAGCFLAFGLANFIFFYILLRCQRYLPGNPAAGTPLTPDLSFNTAVSFLSNTSWQAYSGETTLSYITQMAGVTAQSFTSAAAGMAVAMALIRGFARNGSARLGNFWVDLTRAVLYILLPLSLPAALLLCSQGVLQTLHPYRHITALEGAKQAIALGPVASQESIKLLSSDGGGFFNANSAHPFENPAPAVNLFEMLLILAMPAAFTYTFGEAVRDRRQGWTLFAVMFLLFAGGAAISTASEASGNPMLRHLGVVGGNMEGKEVRFGTAGSALFSMASTASSDGAVNSAHDSYTPLAGLIQMLNLKTGEVIFGGVGSGILSMILLVLIAVFIAGLMVGRSPEYLGKRIEAKDIKMVMLALVVASAANLVVSSATFLLHFPVHSYWNPPGAPVANLRNAGPHGLSEILYANASAVGTNGSAFAGLNANTPWFNLTLGLEMLIGRFLVMVPALALAGSLARKKRVPVTIGTMPTHGVLFAVLLVGTIVIVTALTFFPALSLGPIAEHYLMHSGVVFR
ncbi:MAG: potassium-transporting ATPase subunit KdpA [Bryobacteraceae bacterium]